MALSEFHIARRDFWFGWTYPALIETIYLRVERQPEPDAAKPKDAEFGSPRQLDNLFS